MKSKQQSGNRKRGKWVAGEGDWTALPVPCDQKPSGSSEVCVLWGEGVTGPTTLCFQAAELGPRYPSALRGSAYFQAAKGVLKEWVGCLRGLTPSCTASGGPYAAAAGLLVCWAGLTDTCYSYRKEGGSGLRFKCSYLKYPWDV